MDTIVLATNNPGKAREFNDLLAGENVQVQPQSAFNISEVDETGLSFVENALLKARHAAQHSGLSALADDSGLVVDALDGAPGIYSARYAGSQASDRDNIEKLLHTLSNMADAPRSARFYCALVYLRHATDPTPLICEAGWEGLITQMPQGTKGFGYDPIFFVPSEGKTAAQLSLELKNRLSHRGQALAKFLSRWRGV